jgi:hypothetical protein
MLFRCVCVCVVQLCQLYSDVLRCVYLIQVCVSSRCVYLIQVCVSYPGVSYPGVCMLFRCVRVRGQLRVRGERQC